MRQNYVSEDNQVSQVNFKEAYSFAEVDCTQLLTSLI